MNNLNNKNAKGKFLPQTSLTAFFVLVFALAIPLWVLGAFTSLLILPGLPIDALIAFCPGLAVFILAYRKNGMPGVVTQLKRGFDYRRIKSKVWYVPTLLLMPIVSVLSFFTIRLSGTYIPASRISILSIVLLCIIFFVSALGEELGWSGYATDPIQHRLGAFSASIVLGLVWAVYHYIPLLHVQRSAAWIAGWSLGTVALRVISVWLYNNAGKSVFAVALFHMTINVTWQLFPINGSYYNPGITGVILALAAGLIVAFWGPHTLVRRGKA